MSDADRQAVVAELQRHYIEGRLTSEELGERVSQALQARTFADFGPLLEDLPRLPDLTAAAPPERTPGTDDSWQHAHPMSSPPIGALMLVIGMLALIWVFMMPGLHMGFGFFPWPLLIWGFFFIGRPFRGRRY